MRSIIGRWLPPLPLVFPSILSGVMITLCFPVVSWWWLCFVALVPVLVAVLKYRPTRREAFRAGFLLGASCYFTMLWWIVKLIPSADVTIPWLMTPALILLVVYLALYPAFFLLLLSAVTNWRYGSVFVAAPALWALLELARSRGELGFPWGALGYAVTDVPVLTQLASVTGLLGLSFAIVLVNVSVSGLVAARRASGRVLSAAALLSVLLAWWYFGTTSLERYDRAAAADSTGTAKVRVAVVQPNVDLDVKWKPEFKDSTFRLIDRLATEAAAGGSQLTFFPETAATIYIDHPRYAVYRRHLESIVRRTHTPLFIGILDYRYDGPNGELDSYNSSALFMPDGSVQKYDKHQLLPFGEALPLAWKFRWLQRINFGQANWAPGRLRSPLDAGVVKFTPLICFESVFPYLCRHGVEEGSQLLVNITNDGWFSDTPGPHQHAQMAIMRSVEFRRWLVRSANTGISFIVDPAGRVVESLGLFKEGIIFADVTPRNDVTVYARWGDWLIAVVAVVFLVVALFSRATRVGHDDDDDDADGGPADPLIRSRVS